MSGMPEYYTVLLPEIRYDSNLTANEKIMLTELIVLTSKYGYCFASNAYFAKLYSTTPRTVRRWIRGLKEKGYITVDEGNISDSISDDKRVIRIVKTYSKAVLPTVVDKSVLPADKNVLPADKVVRGGRTKVSGGVGQSCPGGEDKNVPHNNINNNNISNNTSINGVYDDKYWGSQTGHTTPFDVFWDNYPNRKYKDKCMRLWANEACDFKIDQIMDNIRQLKEHHREFSPSITYLENREYENPVEEHYEYF